MGSIRFSVVIPAFNAEACIGNALESCLQQSLPPYEVIVVDDGSTDATVARVQMQFGAAVQLILLEKNQGPAAARNAGMDAARGDYIAFLDADDVWHPDKLACMGRVLQMHPEIDFLFHTYRLDAWPADSLRSPVEPRRLPLGRLLLGNVIATPCAVVRRENALRFNASMRHMEDYDFFLRLAAKKGAWKVEAPLTRLGRPVLSAGGQSSARWKMRIGEWRAWWHFTKMHPAFVLLLPVWILFSIAKHLIKTLR